MTEKNMSIWEVIAALEPKMPVTISDVEGALGSKLIESKRTDNYALWTTAPAQLAEGVSVVAQLLLHPSAKFDNTSAFGLELSGACVPLEEVRRRFADLKISQAPRGRSQEETTVWTTQRPWGYLSFAFKEKARDCLFSVSFRRQLM